MIRHLTWPLRRLFKPAAPMDLQTPRDADPITQSLAVAVSMHQQAGRTEQDGYSTRLRATMDELMRKMDRAPKRANEQ